MHMRFLKRWSLVAGLLLLVTGHWSLVTPKAHAADFTIRPSITVSEEYNDNVFGTNIKTTDYITRLMPGITFGYVGPFWE